MEAHEVSESLDVESLRCRCAARKMSMSSALTAAGDTLDKKTGELNPSVVGEDGGTMRAEIGRVMCCQWITYKAPRKVI